MSRIGSEIIVLVDTISKSEIKDKKPYLPVATFEQVLDYKPGQETTYTASPVVNAVAEALCMTRCIESKELSEYLSVDLRKLSGAIQLDLGMRLIDVIQQYRLRQVENYRTVHPDATLNEVAQACGYASDGSLWRFFQRKLGQTVTGRKSMAGKESWQVMREEAKKKLKGN